jgi:hypothetical protein
VVEHFSLFKRTYEPAALLIGCGMRLSHNRFQHSSSSAMRLEGNDFTIEYNQIDHVVTESDDQGGVDMWFNPSFRGINIRYNYWADIAGGSHEGAAAIRFDDMISGEAITGNIFERCGNLRFGAIQIHGGKDNIIDNNIFYQCRAAVSFEHWGDRWDKELNSDEIQFKLFTDVNIYSTVYLSKYPELLNLSKDIDIHTISNNLIIDCTDKILRSNGKQRLSNNHVITNADTDATFCLERKYEKYGVAPIPIDEIGPKQNKWITGYDPAMPLPYDPMQASDFMKLNIRCDKASYVNDTDDESLGDGLTGAIAPEKSGVVIYPNPAVNLLNIRSAEEIKRLDIINLQGKIMLSKAPLTSSVISLTHIPAGLYIVRITLAKGYTNMKLQVE